MAGRSLALASYVAAAVLSGAAAVSFGQERAFPAEAAGREEAARLMNELMTDKPVGGPFTLTDAEGRKRSLASFRGKVVLLYFGYTYCPDVCPTDLLEIARLMKAMGRDAAKLQPLFVTLDPERDTPQVLRAYAAAFHPRLIALTGSVEEVRKVATSWKTWFGKVQPPDGRPYLIDHTAFTYLIDREGKYLAYFPPGTSGERMAELVREVLSGALVATPRQGSATTRAKASPS